MQILTEINSTLLMKYLLLIVFSYVSTGCFYPKVSLDKKERKSIAYDKKKSVVFHSNSGLFDTVHFNNIGYRRGYEPNFDYWWSLKFNDTSSKKPERGFYYSVSAISNFPKNKYTDQNLNLSLHLRLVKQGNSDDLALSIDEFEEQFILIKNAIPDTLIFSRPVNPEKCTIWNCTKKIYWTIDNGIEIIEKNDGTIWKR
jgi:hypothetical protein